MARSRRLNKDVVTTKTGVEVLEVYCRRCMQTKKPTEFFIALEPYLDCNGLFSVCKTCCNDLYNLFFKSEGSIEKALLKTCRLLNVKYDESAINATVSYIETMNSRGRQTDSFFGIYKARLTSVIKTSLKSRGSENLDLTFHEPNVEKLKEIQDTSPDVEDYYINTWGAGLTEEDYDFLETQYSKWLKTTRCDTYGEELLVREICFKQNEIRKDRILGKNVDSSVKSLQELMKSSALTPAMANAASSGRNAEAFGVWIKDIETKTPAEWYEDQSKFQDMDGLEQDRSDIKRSIGNFITGSRDFNVTDMEEINDGEDPFDEED